MSEIHTPPEPEPLPSHAISSNLIYTPDAARARLYALGFDESLWDPMMENEGGSHFLRSLVYIARQPEPQDINEVYHMMDPTREQYSLADMNAAQAAEQAAEAGAWEAFVDRTPVNH